MHKAHVTRVNADSFQWKINQQKRSCQLDIIEPSNFPLLSHTISYQLNNINCAIIDTTRCFKLRLSQFIFLSLTCASCPILLITSKNIWFHFIKFRWCEWESVFNVLTSLIFNRQQHWNKSVSHWGHSELYVDSTC